MIEKLQEQCDSIPDIYNMTVSEKFQEQYDSITDILIMIEKL